MITVCIPTYHNTKAQLERCFESVSTLSNNVPVLICVDDDDRNYINLVSSCVYSCKVNARILTQKNRGCFAARKRMVQECSTSWIFFLDADDYLTPEFISYLDTFQPNQKYDLYTTRCICLGDNNNFRHRKNVQGVEDVESGQHLMMWGKIIKTKLLQETYKLLPEYPCGLFYGEEIPQAWAFKFFKQKHLNISSICYTDEGETSVHVIDSIRSWKKFLSVVYLVDWYGVAYIKELLTQRLMTVDRTIGKEAISLLRRTMNKAEKAQQIFFERQSQGISFHETALELFGNSDPLNLVEVLGDDK